MRLILPAPALVLVVGPDAEAITEASFLPGEACLRADCRALLGGPVGPGHEEQVLVLQETLARARLAQSRLTAVPVLAHELPRWQALGAEARLPVRVLALGAAVVLPAPHQCTVVQPPLSVERRALPADLRRLTGPFDIVGDVHGCSLELRELLGELGWLLAGSKARHPRGRQVVFLGDLVDHGPDSVGVLRLVMQMVADGLALCVPGDHDLRLARHLAGQRVELDDGLQRTLRQLQAEPPSFSERVRSFIEGLPEHLVLDGGALVASHAGLPEELWLRAAPEVGARAVGEGRGDRFVSGPAPAWVQDLSGRGLAVFGHQPRRRVLQEGHALGLDTGCVLGGRLSAWRYPESELVQVEARRVWVAPARGPRMLARRAYDDLLELADLQPGRVVETRRHGSLDAPESGARCALSLLSRRAVDPRWLATVLTPAQRFLEPRAFRQAARAAGVSQVRALEGGSRVLVALCRDSKVALRRFGAEGRGVVITEEGEPFFAQSSLQTGFLEQLDLCVEHAGLWRDLASDWLLMEAELQPWSLQHKQRLRRELAPASAAWDRGLSAALHVLAGTDNPELRSLREQLQQDRALVLRRRQTWRRVSWEVSSVEDIRLSPLRILACEDRVLPPSESLAAVDALESLQDPLLQVGEVAPVSDEDWLSARLGRRGEGAVALPAAGPAMVCISPELSWREGERSEAGIGPSAALAAEALSRFLDGEPLHRVHECVFGALAWSLE